MRAKSIILLASAGLLLGAGASASAQSSPPMSATNVSASDAPSDDWRERAMLARAEVPDEAPNGRLRDPEGLADLAEAGMPDAVELADLTDGRKSSE
jgi:hypothetical protein